ncbi:MAG: Spo0B domain-containing protein [Micrococcales bacterium]|nr:Spo0B domain-containing protein [Micrococcales bacterium]
MGARRSARRRITLVRQLLIFQLTLLGVILLVVTGASIEQARISFDAQQERRMQTVAEYAAAVPLIRSRLVPDLNTQQYATAVDELRTNLDADLLLVTDPRGKVLSSPADPRLLGSDVRVGEGSPGRGWSGIAAIGATEYAAARAPILSDSGTLEGVMIAARERPSLSAVALSAAPDPLTFLAVAGLLGVLGSVWLASRMKRQTLGLEPDEIASLVEHREAMVHGLLEGIVAVDSSGTITLANDSARRLLGLPADAQGRPIAEVGLDEDTVAAIREWHDDVDRLLINRGTLLALNQTVIAPAGPNREVITTLRDRTQLVALQHELGTSRQATDTLRAQTHEFANRLHTISMLIQLGNTDAAADYIETVSKESITEIAAVRERIADPAVSAVILGKMSLARERGATLTLSPAADLPRLEDQLSADVVTLIGNLVDNALDAVAESAVRRVDLDLGILEGASLRIQVRDSGPGIAPQVADLIFRRGFSSKSDDSGRPRGFGLAVVQLVVTRRDGTIAVRNDGGALFEVMMPVAEPARV